MKLKKAARERRGWSFKMKETKWSSRKPTKLGNMRFKTKTIKRSPNREDQKWAKSCLEGVR